MSSDQEEEEERLSQLDPTPLEKVKCMSASEAVYCSGWQLGGEQASSAKRADGRRGRPVLIAIDSLMVVVTRPMYGLAMNVMLDLHALGQMSGQIVIKDRLLDHVRFHYAQIRHTIY